MMKKFLQITFSLLTILLVWQILSLLVAKTLIIPEPIKTLAVVIYSFSSGQVLIPIWQTTWKVIVALFFSTIIGIPLGFFLGKSPFLYHFFRPWIMVIQSVPVISWLTLVIFAWGVGWKGPIIISILSLLPTSILTIAAGTQNLNNQLLEMAKLYRVPQRRIISDIYIGSLFPFIAAILDVNIGLAWKVILVTEYLCGGNGLGEKILMARMNIDTNTAWALTLIAVILGITTENISKQIFKKVTNDRTLSQSREAFKIL